MEKKLTCYERAFLSICFIYRVSEKSLQFVNVDVGKQKITGSSDSPIILKVNFVRTRGGGGGSILETWYINDLDLFPFKQQNLHNSFL